MPQEFKDNAKLRYFNLSPESQNEKEERKWLKFSLLI